MRESILARVQIYHPDTLEFIQTAVFSIDAEEFRRGNVVRSGSSRTIIRAMAWYEVNDIYLVVLSVGGSVVCDTHIVGKVFECFNGGHFNGKPLKEAAVTHQQLEEVNRL